MSDNGVQPTHQTWRVVLSTLGVSFFIAGATYFIIQQPSTLGAPALVPSPLTKAIAPRYQEFLKRAHVQDLRITCAENEDMEGMPNVVEGFIWTKDDDEPQQLKTDIVCEKFDLTLHVAKESDEVWIFVEDNDDDFSNYSPAKVTPILDRLVAEYH